MKCIFRLRDYRMFLLYFKLGIYYLIRGKIKQGMYYFRAMVNLFALGLYLSFKW